MMSNAPGNSTVDDRLADNVPDAARRLGVCQAMLWRLLKDKEIASFTVGRRRLIPRVEQLRFIETRLAVEKAR
jgi:excisionase family DNA binding protein